eukprot:scaffold77475_cov72-Phaeocystis_antarctica.AAC.3
MQLVFRLNNQCIKSPPICYVQSIRTRSSCESPNPRMPARLRAPTLLKAKSSVASSTRPARRPRGDNSVLDNTDSDCRQDDNQTERESPSPPPPSPSSPPIAHQPVGERQCVVDVKGVTHCVGLPPGRSLDDARVKARLKRSGITLE